MSDDQIVILALETYCGFKLEFWPEYNREKMRAAIEAAIASKAINEQVALRERIDELEAVFETQWDAEQRAIKAWQKKTGKHLTWPDHAKMVEWLMDEREAARAALQFYSCRCDLTDTRSQRCGGAHDEQFCGYVASAALKGEKG